MESELYKSIFEKGEARGRIETLSSMLVRTLTHRLGVVDPAIRERIRSINDADILQAWCNEVTIHPDVETARRLVATIAKV